MEPEGLVPCSQEPENGLYLEPDSSSPQLPTLFPLRSIVIASLYV
jgi:hypothetical protein